MTAILVILGILAVCALFVYARKIGKNERIDQYEDEAESLKGSVQEANEDLVAAKSEVSEIEGREEARKMSDEELADDLFGTPDGF